MARIRVPGRQPVLQRIVAAPLHGRVVSCRLTSLILNVLTHTYTEALGQNIVLLSVDVWLEVQKPAAPQMIVFDVVTGTTEPQNSADVVDWERVVPVFERGISIFWGFCAGVGHRRWDMNFPYVGAGRRFALLATPDANLTGCLSASFQIREG